MLCTVLYCEDGENTTHLPSESLYFTEDDKNLNVYVYMHLYAYIHVYAYMHACAYIHVSAYMLC